MHCKDRNSAGRTTKNSRDAHWQRVWRDVTFILITSILLYVLVSLFSYSVQDPGWSYAVSEAVQVHNLGGRIGASLADFLLYLLGYSAFLIPVALAFMAWQILFATDRDNDTVFVPVLRLIGMFGFLISLASLLSLRAAGSTTLIAGDGGIIGKLASQSLFSDLGIVGEALFLFSLLLISLTLATGLSWLWVMDRLGASVLSGFGLLHRYLQSINEWRLSRALREERKIKRRVDSSARAARDPIKIEPSTSSAVLKESKRSEREQQIPLFRSSTDSAIPPLTLLDEPNTQTESYDADVLEMLSRQIEFKLKEFRVSAQVVGAYPGPVITRFEINLAPGVKVSQISALDKDIARGLSVKAVRVIEVIPGKSLIGLEIPNVNREMIYLSELLRSQVYDQSASPLTLALGKDISGQPMVTDMTKMPHLLVAGTTGSGKSVAVNAMIISLLYKSSPRDVRMLVIDPKMLELSVYEGIPNLLAPVVTDMREAANGLRWCVAEMERRYKLLSAFWSA